MLTPIETHRVWKISYIGFSSAIALFACRRILWSWPDVKYATTVNWMLDIDHLLIMIGIFKSISSGIGSMYFLAIVVIGTPVLFLVFMNGYTNGFTGAMLVIYIADRIRQKLETSAALYVCNSNAT